MIHHNSRGVTAPQGFRASGLHCGIKKPGLLDLALVVSDRSGPIAGVFTNNQVVAAPVILDRLHLRRGTGRAIIVNSGNANACTGKPGLAAAQRTAELLARALNIPVNQVFVGSTGVIGRTLPLDRIVKTLPALLKSLSRSGGKQAAHAIMTTDLKPKTAVLQRRINGRLVTIGGMAKGSGMIHPDMATMLCFIVTDALVAAPMLRKMLTASLERSFNMITVDGDTSTNDMVLVMANGAAGNKRPAPGSKDAKKLQACLDEVTRSLAQQVVKDGEGATKFVEIAVRGAKNPVEAKRAAMAIARSYLVKTALFGEDANWGRIMAVLGSCGVDMEESRTDISFGKAKLVEKGVSTGKQAEKEATAALKQREVHVTVDLHKGKGEAVVWTCDLSYEYVKINAAYRS